jgi:hypothetical protein
MNLRLSIAAALILASVASRSAVAAERYEFYRGIRTLGMGGASVAVVNDETALLVNPAALGKLRDYYITIFDPELELGSQTYSVAGTDSINLNNPQKALTKANLHPDKNMHDRYQLFPSVVVPNFGFGLFGKYETDARLNSTTNKFEYNYVNDYAAVFGVDFRLFNGIIKLGANARAVNHSVAQKTDIDPTSTNLTLNSMLSEGMGVASDAGIIITAPVAYLPTLAATYRDVGRTTYNYRGGMLHTTSTTPDSTPSTLDGAVSISPILGKRMRSTWTVQYSDAMDAYQEKDTTRRIHGGFELNYADALFLRGGWNQRYWTAGVELSIVNYQFQAASYGEDIGVVGAPIEDRRYVVKFAFRF